MIFGRRRPDSVAVDWTSKVLRPDSVAVDWTSKVLYVL